MSAPGHGSGSPDDVRGIWDDPKNVKMFLRGFWILAAVVAVVDFAVHRHVEHPLERIPTFYALYGFVGVGALIFLSKALRRVVMRPEDYYDAE